MSDRASKWHPVSDVDRPFERIAYSFEEDTLSVRMIGARTLVLSFSGVVALRFEQECPGVDFLRLPLPMLGPSQTFPLLVVDHSRWLEAFQLVYRDRSHFALVSSDHLMQVIAKASVKAHWESPL
jgi:hypothetical protein